MTLLETRGLTKRFGQLTAVQKMSLRVEPGERHALIGPNGAGKTTLFHLISGRLRPTEGSVSFRGADITSLAPHKIARLGMARSFQITNIFPHLSVRENVRLAIQAQHGRRGMRLGGRSFVADTADRAGMILIQLNLMSRGEAHDIVDLLSQIPRDITLLLIEHDLDVVFTLSDRITVMQSGQFLATGTPMEVERNAQVQEAYFGF